MFIETNKVINVRENSITYLGDWLNNITQMKNSADSILHGGDFFGIRLPSGTVYFSIVPRCEDYKSQSGIEKMRVEVVCAASKFPAIQNNEYIRQFIESQNSFWRE